MGIRLDSATRTLVKSYTSALDKAQATINQFTGGITLKIWDGNSLKASGELSSPWATTVNGIVTLAPFASPVTLVSGGIPNSETWYITIENADASKTIRGTFGPTGDFKYEVSNPTQNLFVIGDVISLSGVTLTASGTSAPIIITPPPPAPIDPGPPPQNTDTLITVVTVTNATGLTRTNEPISFGLPLSSFALPAGFTNLRVYDDNGSGAAGGALNNFQFTLKSTDVDSKVRFGRVDGILPSIGPSATRKLHVYSSSTAEPTGTAITAADILATNFQCSVSLNIGGVVYTADARAALAGGSTFNKTGPTVHGTFYQGTCSTSILCSMPPQNGGVSHASGDGLRVKFQIYAYKPLTSAVSSGNPISYIYCDVVIENGDVTRVTPEHHYYGLKIERSTSLADPALIFTDDSDADGNVTRYSYPRKLPADTLTLSLATVGSRTFTLTAETWDADILGAYIHAAAGGGKAYVTTRISNTQVTAYVYEAFGVASYASGAWIQEGVGQNYGTRNKVARVYVGAKPMHVVALGNNTSAIDPTTKATLDYLSSSKMIQNYGPTFANITHGTTNLDLMKGIGAIRPFTQRNSGFIGEIKTYMPQTGGRPDIGPLPGWCVSGLIKYTLAGRRRIFENALYASTFNIYASRYSGAPTTGALGVTPRFDNGTNYAFDTRWNQANNIKFPGTNIIEWSVEYDHITSAFYTPYLLTGDMYWLESMNVQTFAGNLSDPGYNGVGINQTSYGDALRGLPNHKWGNKQERGSAWSFRDALYCCISTPDTDVPMIYNSKSFYKTWIQKHWDVFKGNITELTGTTDAHWYNPGSGPRFTSYSILNAPWQSGYNTIVLNQAKEMGLTGVDGATALAWFLEAPVSAYTDTGASLGWVHDAYKLSGFDQAGIRPRTWAAISKATMLEHPNRFSGYDYYEPAENSGSRNAIGMTLSKLSGTDVVVTFTAPFPFAGNPSFYVGGWVRSGPRGETGIGKIVSVAADGGSCVIDTLTATSFAATYPAFPTVAAFTSTTPTYPRIPGPSPADAANFPIYYDPTFATIYRARTVIAIDNGVANATSAKTYADYRVGVVNPDAYAFFINPR